MSNNLNLEMRKIPSLKFLYEISEDGRIFRNVKSKKQLRQHKSNQGYWLVDPCIKGKRKTVTVHSLVAECWLGNRPDGYEIDHKDNNKNNNHYSNLRYVTHSENNLNREMKWKLHVRLLNNNEVLDFNTAKQAAEYLANKYNAKYGTIRFKMSKRRKHIFDYDIEYERIAETIHTGSTEQEIVQQN